MFIYLCVLHNLHMHFIFRYKKPILKKDNSYGISFITFNMLTYFGYAMHQVNTVVVSTDVFLMAASPILKCPTIERGLSLLTSLGLVKKCDLWEAVEKTSCCFPLATVQSALGSAQYNTTWPVLRVLANSTLLWFYVHSQGVPVSVASGRSSTHCRH